MDVGVWQGDLGNDYLIDRAVQRDASYSGIEGLDVQDSMVQETMGAIADRGQEHLVPSDLAVARIRRRLLEAAKALRDTATPPPGVDRPEAYDRWCGFLFAPKVKELAEVYDEAVAERERATHA